MDKPKNTKIPATDSGPRITVMTGEDGASRVTYVEEEYRFAFGLRNAARVMRNSARDIEDGPSTRHQLNSFIYGAIILSYASLEAALNEIIHLHALDSSSPLDEAERKVFLTIGEENLQQRGKTNTLQQYNLLLRIMEKPQLNTGEAPYQAANLVRELRNLLVHPKPGKVVTYVEDEDFDYSSQQTIVRRLRSHLELSTSATFPKEVLTKECAAWAVSSCEAFLHEFVVLSGINPGFITKTE